MDILACPVCKGELELRVEEEEGDEVLEGTLYCEACDEEYPIEEGIPNLLPPDFEE
ncbi:MAG: hypothetical protein MAG715_00051 [Methanonatronarchaeales archaeon]|nr:hypothetical protein [Methanonatronarchaeales archaeon]